MGLAGSYWDLQNKRTYTEFAIGKDIPTQGIILVQPVWALYWNTDTLILLSQCNYRTELLWSRPYDLQSVRYLLSELIQAKFSKFSIVSWILFSGLSFFFSVKSPSYLLISPSLPCMCIFNWLRPRAWVRDWCLSQKKAGADECTEIQLLTKALPTLMCLCLYQQ